MTRLLPDIRGGAKPHSTPSSPVGARGSHGPLPSLASGGPGGTSTALHRTSLNGSAGTSDPGFIAGATVAGPIAAHSHSHGHGHGYGSAAGAGGAGGAGVLKTASAAAAQFALAGGNLFSAAAINYNAPPSPAVRVSISGEAAGPGTSAGGAAAGLLRGAASPEPGGAAAGSPSRTGTAGALAAESSALGGAEGGGEEDEEGALAAGVDDDDEVMMAENPRLRGRLVALPNILCRSANGDVFLVELG